MIRWTFRARGLALGSAVTIALGVGALTTALGVADAALWRDPPFPAADDLVLLFSTRRSATETSRPERWSYPRIQRLRAALRPDIRIANVTPTAVSLTGTDLTEPLQGEVVSPEYFGLLGATPAIGRVFGPDEDRVPGGSPVAVLGHELWRRRFGADSGAIGRIIEINRHPLTIIGVLPEGFRGVSDAAQFWIPTTMAPSISYGEYLTTNQNFISLVGRLPREGALADLRTELAAVMPSIARAVPSDDDDSTTVVSATATSLGTARIAPERRRAVWLLLGAVGVLHLLACANTASLLLGRAIAQRREAAVRLSLGSDAGALFRRYLGQGAGLVMVGAVGGLALAWAGSKVVVPINAWGPGSFYGSIASFSDPAFGWRTVLAWLTVTAATIILVAWAPAVATVRGDLAGHLRDGVRSASAAGVSLRRPTARGFIVAIESALAVLLLAVGSLMIESFARLRATPLGVDSERVLTFTLQPPESDLDPTGAAAFIDRMLAAITSVPGVVSASVDGGAPLSGSASTTVRIVGQAEPGPGQAPVVLRHYVGPEHFTTLGIPLIRGRAFTDQDRAGRPRVAIVSESAARRFWPGMDPIGQRVWFGAGQGFDRPDSTAEIIGIVGDVKYRPLDREPNLASFYTSYQQFTYGWRTYFVRTEGAPTQALAGIRAAIHAVEPNVPLREVRPLESLIGASWSRNRFDAFFYGGFAALALLLAATGIYAVVAYAVSQRDREIAIRMAVGASPAAVFRLVIREGMGFPIIGLLAGAAATYGAARLLRSSVYGVAPDDPRIVAVAAVMLAGVAVLACALPARRALRVNPQDSLRAD